MDPGGHLGHLLIQNFKITPESTRNSGFCCLFSIFGGASRTTDPPFSASLHYKLFFATLVPRFLKILDQPVCLVGNAPSLAGLACSRICTHHSMVEQQHNMITLSYEANCTRTHLCSLLVHAGTVRWFRWSFHSLSGQPWPLSNGNIVTANLGHTHACAGMLT